MASAQQPIASGFGADSTTADVVAGLDLTRKTAIVTGGSCGLGLETVRALAGAGAHVIVASRNPQMVRAALGTATGNIEVETLDLMTPSSIDRFADQFLASERALSIFVAAASITAPPPSRDTRGNETQFSVNHLGHFQLAVRLWPALRRSGSARLVAISSNRHQISGVDFDDVNFERRPYDKWIAYGQSKTANALFAVAFDARGERVGIRAFSLHPGTVLRPFARHLWSREIATSGVFDDEGRLITVDKRDLKTAEQGAATVVWCAASPRLDGVGGVYCENCDVARIASVNTDEMLGVREWAVDREHAERLWSLSEGLTGARLP